MPQSTPPATGNKRGLAQASGVNWASGSRVRHYGGFVLAGSLAFLADVGILLALTEWIGLNPFLARLLSISIAMVVSWAINRTVTFPATKAPSFAEFARFASVAWSANAFNYLVFSTILLIWPATASVLAAAISAIAAMLIAYFGMRFAVFRKH